MQTSCVFRATSHTFILLHMLSDISSTNHNEKLQLSFCNRFLKATSCVPVEIMFCKLVFDVLLCTCLNNCNVSMAYVCFKCNYCKGEYQTLRAYQCHRQHQRSVGTPCSDPRSQRTISFSERTNENLSTGINPSAADRHT